MTLIEVLTVLNSCIQVVVVVDYTDYTNDEMKIHETYSGNSTAVKCHIKTHTNYSNSLVTRIERIVGGLEIHCVGGIK